MYYLPLKAAKEERLEMFRTETKRKVGLFL